MKSSVEKPIPTEVKNPKKPEKTRPPFPPPLAVQLARHWKLLLGIVVLLTIFMIGFVLPDSFLPLSS